MTSGRQMNMDYALCNALKYNTEGITKAFTFYDINCQYHKHLQDRVKHSPYLNLPPNLDIVPGIGLWHVHGHQDSCFSRYASNFIPGAGRIDGEIMETLWAPLNIISPSARGMSTPHRKELLNFQMNDCNFMKMVRMSKFILAISKPISLLCMAGRTLCRKYKEAIRGVAASKMAFAQLDATANRQNTSKWQHEEDRAQLARLTSPAALDIYDVQMEKGG
jgi:hypothetical protein